MFAAAGISKFLGGMLGAAFSPRLMLAVGLMATSVINIVFGFTASVAWWTALWAMNGGLQVLITSTPTGWKCVQLKAEAVYSLPANHIKGVACGLFGY